MAPYAALATAPKPSTPLSTTHLLVPARESRGRGGSSGPARAVRLVPVRRGRARCQPMTTHAAHHRPPIVDDDPDLPACLAPHKLSPAEIEQLRELDKVAGRLVRAGVLPRGAALQLMRYANRVAAGFVAPRIKLVSVLGALVRAARDGTLTPGAHWTPLADGRLAFHVPSALEVLRQRGRTRLRLGELTRLVQAGAVYRASWIIDTRRRVTFRPNDRRRALVLDEQAISGRGPVHHEGAQVERHHPPHPPSPSPTCACPSCRRASPRSSEGQRDRRTRSSSCAGLARRSRPANARSSPSRPRRRRPPSRRRSG